MTNRTPLGQYCERLTNNGAKVSCRVCLTNFLTTNGEMNFLMTTDDPIFNELGSGDMNDFVAHSCAKQHGCHEEKPEPLLKIADGKENQKKCQPTDAITLLSDTHLSIRKMNDRVSFVVDEERGIVKCRGCLNDLGYISQANPNILQLHLTSLNVEDQNINRSLIAERFGSVERFFAFLLLHHSGFDSSLKLVFRTCEKEPYLLIWLIEPIFVFGGGKLKKVVDERSKQLTKARRNSDGDLSTINTFCALKVLYKVFDVGSDQKRHDDPSISYIDVPLASCMNFEEILLRNSTRLPNESRVLGNFLISFLNIDDDD